MDIAVAADAVGAVGDELYATHAETALDSGCAAYLVQPYVPRALAETVKSSRLYDNERRSLARTVHGQ